MTKDVFNESAVAYIDKKTSNINIVALLKYPDSQANLIPQFTKDAKTKGFEVAVIDGYFKGADANDWTPSLSNPELDGFIINDPFKNAFNLIKEFGSVEDVPDEKYDDVIFSAEYLEDKRGSFAEVCLIVADHNLMDNISCKKYASQCGLIITDSMEFEIDQLKNDWNLTFLKGGC